MSLQAMGLVWKHSKAQGSALVLMLAIADYADENLEAWPSIGRMAQRARITGRNVQKQIRRLVEMGELQPVRSGINGTIVYRITCDLTPVTSDTPVESDTPVAIDTPPVASDTPPLLHVHAPKGLDFCGFEQLGAADAPDEREERKGGTIGGDGEMGSLWSTSVTDITTPLKKNPKKNPPMSRSSLNGSKRDIDEAFEAWWRIYPRRVAKTAARKAYTRIITKGEASHEDLAAGAARFADAVAGFEARFIAHPATWLNAGRWLDEPDPAAGGGTRNDQHSRVGEVLRGIALFDRLPRADVG